MAKQSGSNLLQHFLAERFQKHLLTLICWMDDCEQHENKLKLPSAWAGSSASKEQWLAIKFTWLCSAVSTGESSALCLLWLRIAGAWRYTQITEILVRASSSLMLPSQVGAFVSSRSCRIDSCVLASKIAGQATRDPVLLDTGNLMGVKVYGLHTCKRSGLIYTSR